MKQPKEKRQRYAQLIAKHFLDDEEEEEAVPPLAPRGAGVLDGFFGFLQSGVRCCVSVILMPSREREEVERREGETGSEREEKEEEG